MSNTRKGTCEVCRRVRKLFRCGDGYRFRCSECVKLEQGSPEWNVAVAAGRERVKERSLASRRAYPCVGGPLDGQHATTYDFYNDGVFAHLKREYVEYNRSTGSGARMIFVHLTPELREKSARQR